MYINKMIYPFLFLLYCFGFSGPVASVGEQTEVKTGSGDLQKPEARSVKEITSYYESLSVKTFLSLQSQDLDLKYFKRNDSGESSSKTITYVPSTDTNIGIGMSYRWFGFSLSKRLKSTQDKTRYGKSEYFDFQFFSYWQKIGIDLFFAGYNGYYLKNSGEFGLKHGDPGTIRSDLSTAAIGGNFIYCFSDSYSLSAAFKQTEQQERSTGSFMLMFSGKLFSVNSDSSLIVPSEESNFYGDAGYKSGEYSSFGIAAGYGYTLRLWRLSFAGAFFFGSGIIGMKYEVASGTKEKSQSYVKVNLKLSATYNGELYFGGVNLSVDKTATEAFWVNTSGISVGLSNVYLEILFGRRFNW